MDLEDYLQLNKMSAKTFGLKHGISYTTLYASMKGKRRLNANTCLKIEKITEGKVNRIEAMWPRCQRSCGRCSGALEVMMVCPSCTYTNHKGKNDEADS